MKWMSIGMAPQIMKTRDMNRFKKKSMVSFPDVILC